MNDPEKHAPVHLDLSEGREPVINVSLLGWPEDRKQAYLDGVRGLQGVVSASTAGGFTSILVRYDPEQVNGSMLGDTLSDLSLRQATMKTGNSVVQGPPEPPEGHHLFADTFGNVVEKDPDLFARALALQPQLEDIEPATEVYKASSWTGITGGAERLYAVKALFPSAITAVDALLFEMEQAGGNGGPPLDDRAGAVEALKGLRDTLNAILELAENNDLESGLTEGLLGKAIGFSRRATDLLASNPVGVAVVGMAAAMASLGGVTGAVFGAIGAIASMVPGEPA